jgi:hypothetical protein
VKADGERRVAAKLDVGEDARAITTAEGFSWVERTVAPDLDAKLTLSR